MDLLAEHIQSSAQFPVLADSDIDDICRSMDRDPVDQEDQRKQYQEICALIRDAPHHPHPQLLAAKFLERTRRRADMLDTWSGILERFPNSHTALRLTARWLCRESRDADAVHLLQERTAHLKSDPEAHAKQAELFSEIRDEAARDTLFEQLLAKDPDNTRVRVIYGKTLFSRGQLTRALEILDPVRDQRLSPSARRVVEQSDRAVEAVQAISAGTFPAEHSSGKILANAIGLFRHRNCRPPDPNRLGGVVLYTGSLGAGGAERQMTRIATTLHRRSRSGRRVRGTHIDGPVSVLVNNIDASRRKDFYLDELHQNHVPVGVVKQMSVEPPAMSDQWALLEPIVPLLPRHARFGLDRMANHLAAIAPEVLYIWQDGAVLTGALAALIAGVPHIAISLRGMPPNLRPHLMKPEYLDMYSALAEVPGVSFSTNSATAADAYAEWIGLDRARISVIYNAATPLDDTPSGVSQRALAHFEASAGADGITLGGVFRFNENKRPLMWLDWAAQASLRFGSLKFILVGGGEQLETARAHAASLGIADRVLFVGNTSDVGFWLSKFDIFALLSRHEGLPNVLIEAQLQGVPVISTPAGGAAETFANGRTGVLLSSAQNPDYREFEAALERMITGRPGHSEMGKAAIRETAARHDTETILAQTVRFLQGQHVDGPAEVGQSANISKLASPRSQQRFDKRVVDAYNLLAGR